MLLCVSCGAVILVLMAVFEWFFGLSGEVWIFLVDKSVIKVLFC